MSLGLELGLTGIPRGPVLAWATPGDGYVPLGGITAFTRADAATCATYVDSSRVRQTVLANVLRDAHYIGGIRTILLESERANRQTKSQNITTAGGLYTAQSGMTTTTGQADAAAGTNATLLTQGVGGSSAVWRAVVPVGDGTKGCGLDIKQGNFTQQEFGILDDTAGSWRHRVRATWAAGVPTLSSQSNPALLLPPIQLTNGWWRALWAAGGVIAANTNRFFLFNNVADDVGKTGLFCGLSVEDAAFPASYIATDAAAVTRAVDALTFGGVVAPGTATLYYRYYDLATGTWTDVAAAYTSAAPIVPPVDRAYRAIAVLNGSLTAAQCRTLLGYA